MRRKKKKALLRKPVNLWSSGILVSFNLCLKCGLARPRIKENKEREKMA